MVRDLSGDNFRESNLYLGEQITELSAIKQSLASALSKEYSSEFPNGLMKTKYGELSSLFAQKTNDNINYEITLGKKNTYLCNDDTNGAEELKMALEDVDSSKSILENMANSITACLSGLSKPSPSVNLLINVLPQSRADEINDGGLFVSPNGKYLYYMGYPYEVYNPTYFTTTGPTFSAVDTWTIDKIKTVSSTDVDVWDGINGFFNSNAASEFDQDASVAFNLPMFGFATLEAIADSRTTTTIEAIFMTNQNGERRVIIGMTNSSIQNRYNTWDYTGSSSMYDNCDNVSNYIVSSAAESAYEVLTGNTAAHDFSTQYDVHITLDERHQYDEGYNYYISFGNDGKAYMTANTYSGDKIEVTQFTNVMSLRVNETTVMESPLSDYNGAVELDNSELLIDCLMSE